MERSIGDMDPTSYAAAGQRASREIGKVFLPEGTQQRIKDNIGFIQTVLNPNRPTKIQPSAAIAGANAFVKVVDYETTYAVTSKVTAAQRLAFGVDVHPTGVWLANDMPENDTGYFIHFTQEGVDAIYHYGVVMGSKTQFVGVSASTGATGIANVQNFNGLTLAGHCWVAPVGGTTAGASYSLADQPAFCLCYQQPLLIPRLGAAGGIKVSPELDKNFSRCRMYAGRIDIYSSTIPTGNASLNGTFTTSAIADTRDIASNEVSGIINSYDVTDLQQQSVSASDVLKGVPAVEGIVSLIGPDFPQDYTQPSQASTDTLHGEFKEVQITNFNASPWPTATVVDPPTNLPPPRQVATIWVSPWATRFSVSNTSTANGNYNGSSVTGFNDPLYHNYVYPGAINETGIFDVSVRCRWHMNASENNNDNSAQTRVSFTYIFAHIDDRNLVRYSMRSEIKSETKYMRDQMWTRNFTTSGGSYTDALEPPSVFTCNAMRMRRPPGAKFIGCFISITSSWVQAPDVSAANIGFSDLNLMVQARNVDQIGRVGPAHIIQYQKMAIGQNIEVKGEMLVQCVAQGDLASFTQSMVTEGRSTADLNVQGLLFSLFKSNQYVRRFYNRQIYQARIIPWVEELTADALIAQLEGTNGMGAAASAGLFSGLGQSLGGLAGPMGGAIGGALGGIGDALFGSSGQFGAAGQFGSQFSSAGQFGDFGSSGRIRQRY